MGYSTMNINNSEHTLAPLFKYDCTQMWPEV